VPWCHELGLIDLVEQELQLRQGQANDTLHEIRLGLADKVVLFLTEVRHGRNYVGTTRAWKKVADLDAMVKRYAAVYHHCRKQMVALEAEPRILDRYKVLSKKDLTVSTAVSDPNARGHHHDSLAWFWTMDILKDTDKNDWMSECKPFHAPSYTLQNNDSTQFTMSTGCRQRQSGTDGLRKWSW